MSSPRSASSLWPPPDALIQVGQISGKILVPVRYFISAAQDSNLKLKDVEQLQQLINIRPTAAEEQKEEEDIGLEMRKNGLTDAELITALERDADRVILSVARLVSMITRNKAGPEILINQSRDTVTLAGEFMSVIEEIKVSSNFSEKESNGQLASGIRDYEAAKEAMYSGVNELITAARTIMDEFAPPNAMVILLDRASAILSKVDELVLAAKIVVDLEDQNGQRIIQREANRFQDATKRDSELHLLQRRAMSLTLNSSSENLAKDSPRASGQLNRDLPDLDQISFNDNKTRNASPIIYARASSNPVLGKSTLEGNQQPEAFNPGRRPSGAGLMDELGRGVKTYDAPRAMGSVSRANSQDGLKARQGMDDRAGIPSPSPPPLPNSQDDDFEIKETSQKSKLNKFFGENVPDRKIGPSPEPPDNLRQEDLKNWVEKKQTPVRLRVFNAFKMWLENFYLDEDYPALQEIMDLATGPMSHAQASIGKRLESMAIAKLTAPPGSASYPPATLPPNMSVEPPPAIIPRVPATKLTLEDIDPLEICRQLTIAQSRVFNSIHPTELIDKAWQRAPMTAPNVRTLSEVSNRITNWVVSSILFDTDVRKRAATLKHFVKTADCCLLLNNYELLMAFLSALNSSAISRMKRTWEVTSNKTQSTLETLRKVMDSAKNHAEYRNRIRNGSPPFLPFIGLYLTDLTFVADGNPNMRTQKLINFDKHVKAYKIITDLQRFQMPFALFEVPEIMNWILTRVKSPNQRSAQELYEISLKLEPRENEEMAAKRELDEKVQELTRAGLL
ncbi:hypothetical protein HDU97_006003 [Phlyctochytrium planicorne]|nr:hypothetical protein HDU97_006003 [Phlyctochytrium planicorne]